LATIAIAVIGSFRTTGEGLLLLPGPDTINLNSERPAEHNPDQHDCSEHRHTLRALVDYDGSDDVSDNEDFKAQQYDSSKMLAEVVIRTGATSWDQVENAGMKEDRQSTQYQDGHADGLYHLDDVLDVVIETQGACPRYSRDTAKLVRFHPRAWDLASTHWSPLQRASPILEHGLPIGSHLQSEATASRVATS
jgi:hypothetical protein